MPLDHYFRLLSLYTHTNIPHKHTHTVHTSLPGVFVKGRYDAGILSSDGQQTSDITTQDQQLTAYSTHTTGHPTIDLDQKQHDIAKIQMTKTKALNALTQSAWP